MRGADFVGKVLDGRYRVDSELGVGGMATVYIAWQESLKRKVVVKVPDVQLLRNEGFRIRFQRETASLVALDHPYIVPVFDAGEVDGTPYFVMKYLEGGSLRDRLTARIKSGDHESPEEILSWLLPVAKALDFIHAQEVVHRDVKPANILFDKSGANPFLSDFGIAKALGNALERQVTRPGATPGTPTYMAPEAGGDEGLLGSADQYALGIIVYEALSGRVPFRGETPLAVMAKKMTEDPREISETSPNLQPGAAAAVMRVLNRDPMTRYGSCTEFANAFAGGLTGAPAPKEKADPTWTVANAREEPDEESSGAAVEEPEPSRPAPPPVPRPQPQSTGGGGAFLKIVAVLIALGAIGAGAVWLLRDMGDTRVDDVAYAEAMRLASGDWRSYSERLAAIDEYLANPEGRRHEEAREKREAILRQAGEKRDGLLKKGADAEEDENWAGAIGHYREAARIAEDAGIDGSAATKGEARVDATKVDVAEYDSLLAAGDEHLSTERWQAALTAYEKADGLAARAKRSGAKAKAGIRRAREIERRLDANGKYEKRLATAQVYLDAKDWANAKKEYEAAKTLAPAAGRDGSEADVGIARAAAGRLPAAERIYRNHLATANGHLTRKEWSKAKEAFLAAKKAAPAARQAITEAEEGAARAEQGLREDQAEYDRLLKSGAEAEGSGDWDAAEKAFAAAKALAARAERSEEEPRRSKDRVKGKREEQIRIREATEGYSAKLADAAGFLERGSWREAEAAYEKAVAFAKEADLSHEEADEGLTKARCGPYEPATFAGLERLLATGEWKPADPPWSEQKRREALHVKSGLSFVLVPAGRFVMGSNEKRELDENPPHEVTVPAFLLAKTECTRGAWVRVGATDEMQRGGPQDLPVGSVSWTAASAWCKEAGLRLPSEAEWEYACRAGSTTNWSFGNTAAQLGRYAQFQLNNDKGAKKVGGAKPNAWGLHDMHGNLWEWCRDRYHPYQDDNRPAGERHKPYEAGDWLLRISRGGSYMNIAWQCRSAYRVKMGEDDHGSSQGFRPAASLPGKR